MKCQACPIEGECYGETTVPHMCRMAARGDSDRVRARQSLPPPVLPPVLTRVGNFVAAVLSHVAAGLPTLDETATAARMAACEKPCEKFLPPNACCDCGCTDLRRKASWADSVCPLGMWTRQ